MDVIHFYGVSEPHGCFSNFSPHPIRLKGRTWPTSEHYFQAQKFVGSPDEEEVRLAGSPMIAARMGRSRKRPLRKDWESVKDRIMYEAVLAKFTQYADLQEMLLGTGVATLVEHTENDDYWGDGGDGRGKNMLGTILMRVRDELRQQAGENPSLVIRAETTADHTAVHEVNQLAFGGDDEAALVDALRDGGYVRVSLVAVEAERIVGHILFCELPILTERGVVEALALAPLAVRPDRQRNGIGSRLVREGLRICREAGHRIVVVVGHPDYYPRFHFSATLAVPLKSPFSGPVFMATELVPGALDGVEGKLAYPPPFGLA